MHNNIYIIHSNGSGEMKCGEHRILLDAEDVEMLSNYQWSVGNHGYATCGAGKNQVLMHRLLTKASPTDIVDHINRNRLNNRKENLRLVTHQENVCNSRQQDNNLSGIKGVCQLKNGKWQAQINHKNKAIYLGTYNDPISAGLAYDSAAISLFGEYAYLNYPEVSEYPKMKEIKRRHKFQKNEVDSIRKLREDGLSINDIAAIYNKSYSSIHRLLSGKTFGRVSDV